jgi:hypothetical protein
MMRTRWRPTGSGSTRCGHRCSDLRHLCANCGGRTDQFIVLRCHRARPRRRAVRNDWSGRKTAAEAGPTTQAFEVRPTHGILVARADDCHGTARRRAQSGLESTTKIKTTLDARLWRKAGLIEKSEFDQMADRPCTAQGVWTGPRTGLAKSSPSRSELQRESSWRRG